MKKKYNYIGVLTRLKLRGGGGGKSLIISGLLLLMFTALQAQEIVKGVVLDNTGEPLPGVYIESESGQRTETDANGKYTITAKQGESLTFSFIGKEDIVKEVTSEVLNVEFYSKISEVVVTAQGIKQEKRSLGYAIATVGNEDFQSKQQTDILTSITGKVPGLDIIKETGIAGASSTITVRGRSSINGSNEPLIIVDGVPTQGDLTEFDSENIKKFSVLKGLAASVLYGSAGRNGVVLIETYNASSLGKEQKLNIQLKQGVYVTRPHLPDFQNTYGQGSYQLAQTGSYGSFGAPFSEEHTVPHHYSGSEFAESFPQYQGVTERYQAYPNNVKDFFRDGIGQNTYVNISKGNKNTTFGLHAGYTDEQGYLPNNSLKKIDVGLGGRAKYNKFSFDGTINYLQVEYKNTNTGIFPRILFTPRSLDLQSLPYEDPLTHKNVYYRSNFENPYWATKYTGDETQNYIFRGNAGITYQLNPYLQASYKVGLEQMTADSKSYTNKGALNDPLGSMSISHYVKTLWNHRLSLHLDRLDFGNFGLNADGGLETRQNTYEYVGNNYQKQIVFGFIDPGGFEEASLASYYTYKKNIMGLYGQTVLDYKKYAYLTLSARNDWSSVLPKENNAKFYPSVSLSFIPTDAFQIKSNLLNYLKTRVAYATSAGFPGVYKVSDNPYSISQRAFAKRDGSMLSGMYRSSLLGNPDLKPELHREFEAGIDSEWLDHRIFFNGSLYYRISKDQIVKTNMDEASGYYSTYTNIGRVDNKGIELDLGIVPVKTDHFTWRMDNLFNAAESRVYDLEADKILIGGYTNIGAYAVNGQPYGTIMGSYYLRDDQGRLLINPNKGELITSNSVGKEIEIIADPTPDYKITNINTFSYKGWRLKTQWEYTHGGEGTARTVNRLLIRGVTKDTQDREGLVTIPGVLGDPNTGKPILDKEGKEIPNTLAMPLQDALFSTLYPLGSNNAYENQIYDLSVLRLREVSLAYTLPEHLLEHTFIHQLTFTLSAENLWYYTPHIPKHTRYDPEVKSIGRVTKASNLGSWNLDSAPPASKRFAFAVKITF